MAMLFAGIVSGLAVDYTATAFITMDGNQMKLRESATFSAGVDGTYSVTNLNENGISAYYGGARYLQFATNDLEGLNLEIHAAVSNETLTFSNVIGTLYLVDNVAKQCKPIVEGDSYTFTATAGASVADRFYISKTEVVFQTEFVCQVDGGLSFHGDVAYSGLVIYNENGNEVEPAFDLAVGEDKFVAIAAAGRYYIKNGDQKIFFVVR